MENKIKQTIAMKTTRILKLIMVSILIGVSLLASAQEYRVSFCDNIQIIDSIIGRNVTLFKPYKDFQQATLLLVDNQYVLNITYKKDGVFEFDRKPITEQELAMICEEIKIKTVSEEKFSDDDMLQEARRRFITSTTVISLGLYSWAIPYSLGAEDGKAYIASFMFIGGGGFFIPLLATKDREITDGMERGFTMGAANGAIHGLAFKHLIYGRPRYYDMDYWDGYYYDYEAYDRDYEKHFRASVGLTALFSIGEGFTTLYLAKKNDYSWGRMSAVGSGGIWGSALGLSMPIILFESESNRLLGFSTLAFSAAGMAGGNYLYNKQKTTHGDVTVINSYGLLGTYYPIVMLASFEAENERAYLTGAILGASAGFALGIHKTKSYDYSRQQGNLIAIGEGAGGLIGAGLGALVEAEYKGFLWLTALGATGGIFLTDFLVKDMMGSGGQSASNFKFQINPYGLMGSVGKSNNRMQKPFDPRYPNTIANLNWTF